MNTKCKVSKRYSPLTGKKQWAIVCCKCWELMWAPNWGAAMRLASYECDSCELQETAKAALEDLGVYRA